MRTVASSRTCSPVIGITRAPTIAMTRGEAGGSAAWTPTNIANMDTTTRHTRLLMIVPVGQALA
jgi:hypothetical protein